MSYCFDPQESPFVSKKGFELGYTVMVFVEIISDVICSRAVGRTVMARNNISEQE